MIESARGKDREKASTHVTKSVGDMSFAKKNPVQQYGAASHVHSLPPGAKTPAKKAVVSKKKKKKHGTDAKLQFPLLRNDDSLDDMLKDMLGEKVMVYGDLK